MVNTTRNFDADHYLHAISRGSIAASQVLSQSATRFETKSDHRPSGVCFELYGGEVFLNLSFSNPQFFFLAGNSQVQVELRLYAPIVHRYTATN